MSDVMSPTDQGMVPLEQGIAPEAPPRRPLPSGLPPGIHPNDPSSPYSGAGFDDNPSAPPDTYGTRSPGTGRPPFATKNAEALAVFARAAHDWTANTFTFGTVSPALQLLGRQVGRTGVWVYSPVGATQGGIVAPTEGEVQQGNGATILPGASPLWFPTEAPIWGGLITGQTTGVLVVVAFIDPPGGSYGGQ